MESDSRQAVVTIHFHGQNSIDMFSNFACRRQVWGTPIELSLRDFSSNVELIKKKVKLIFTDLKGESHWLQSFEWSLRYEITELRSEIYYLQWPQNLEMNIYAHF